MLREFFIVHVLQIKEYKHLNSIMKKTTLILTLLFTCKNIFNQIQKIQFDEITFINIIIHPPFWRTTLAYILYAALFLMLLMGYTYWRNRRLRKEKLVLEKAVNKRTEELHEVNTLLETQNEELIRQKKNCNLRSNTCKKHRNN